ncbi:MAG: hypothetical protein PHE55_14180 [Methylococcaceae bacterium]|nr:hypothetical protein [Methylococcaceae bacterium]
MGISTHRLFERGAFSSREASKPRILAFIDDFDQTLAMPSRGTDRGKALAAMSD